MSFRSRAAITSFCAAHPLLHRSPAGWIEYSASDAPSLRRLCDSGQSSAEYSSLRNAQWWERFFACGIIGALEQAGLWQDGVLRLEPQRVGVCFSSSKGRPALLEKQQEYSFAFAPDWATPEILACTGARCKTLCPVAACAGGAQAVALGAQWIEDGLCDVVLCGAIEAELAELVLAGYRSLGALSSSGVMRPFDVERDGFVPGCGAACLILENENRARERGAKIWARVAGWSLACDGTSLTGMQPSGDSISVAMREAMRRASTEHVDYINAHGTATHMNDEIESRAILRTLGGDVPVSSTKAMTGHMLGAAGAVEAVLCLLAMEQNYAPPSINLQQTDASCAAINLLREGKEIELQRVMTLSYGFGGHIGVLLFEGA